LYCQKLGGGRGRQNSLLVHLKTESTASPPSTARELGEITRNMKNSGNYKKYEI